MYTQNGNPDRNVEAVLIEVIWPEFIADLEAGDYSNKLFVPIRFLDFTPGYDTNSAVLFPETIAMREVPKFSWGAIFADREAARFRSRRRQPPPTSPGWHCPSADAARLLADQKAQPRRDLRDVGPGPRPHPHPRRPAVRPVHDQAADAVLPLLVGGTALRSDGVPRIGQESSAVSLPASPSAKRDGVPSRDDPAHWFSTRSCSTASSASRSRGRGCATTTGSAASCSSPGCTSTGCCTGPTTG